MRKVGFTSIACTKSGVRNPMRRIVSSLYRTDLYLSQYFVFLPFSMLTNNHSQGAGYFYSDSIEPYASLLSVLDIGVPSFKRASGMCLK